MLTQLILQSKLVSTQERIKEKVTELLTKHRRAGLLITITRTITASDVRTGAAWSYRSKRD